MKRLCLILGFVAGSLAAKSPILMIVGATLCILIIFDLIVNLLTYDVSNPDVPE